MENTNTLMKIFTALVTHSQNERQPPCWKRSSPRWGHWSDYTQEGTTKVQAKADPHIQEQGT